MLFRIFFLDSNTLNDFAEGNPDATEIIKLIKEHDLLHCFLIPYTVKNEVESKSTPVHVRNELYNFLYTTPVELNTEEITNRSKLFHNVKGNAKSKNIFSDLQHIAEAAKYGAHYFVTSDSRLLKRKDKINNIYPTLHLIDISEANKIINDACKSN